MGRILASVTIANAFDSSKSLKCEALVDIGVHLMVLPAAWKHRFGSLHSTGTVELAIGSQWVSDVEVCGPVRIQIDGFRPIYTEVAFVDMKPERGDYEPLIGYIVLEQSLAGVDMISHRLVHLKHFDLKSFTGSAAAQPNFTA